MTTHTLASITKLYNETFYIEDDAPVALMAAIIVSAKLGGPPVWLYIVGPSSGGKSVLIEAFSGVKDVTQVSDLTVNTFLSGAPNKTEEPSLLKRLGLNFIITMKDFTTILSKAEEAQEAIISQMREIYDGHFTKFTGNGKPLEWGGKGAKKGKATFIMACTEAIHGVQEKFSEMGTRAINYVLLPQNRKLTTKRALKNNGELDAKMMEIQEVFAEYIEQIIQSLPAELPELSEEFQDQIIDVADFATICRSVVKRDYRGVKNLALTAEMPMRMSKQLLVTAQLFIHLGGGTIPEYLKNTVFKIALDSIPKQRRLVLEVLAKYRRVNIAGISDLVNYPPDRVKEWIEDLQMFDVVERIRTKNTQHWKLKDEYRKIMTTYLGVIPVDKDLEGDEDGYQETASGGGNYQDISYEMKELEEIHNKQLSAEWDKM